MKRTMMIAGVAVLAVTIVTCLTTAQPRGRGVPPIMTALDADRNGEISAEEIAKAPEALKKLDRNKDGKLALEEFAGRGGRPGGGPTAGSGPINFTSSALPKTDEEKKILAVLAEMNDERRGMMNVPIEDGRLLRLLVEAIGAKHVVEIGTSSGYSGIWQCMALRTTGGKLTTYEIDAGRAKLARANFKRAGVDGLVTLVEGDAHKEVAKLKEPIDLLFLDADKEGYIDYLKKLMPLLKPGALIVAHNMNQRQADVNFIKAITTNKDLETLFLHMDAAGVSVSMKKR